jgi:hypothetical protein
MAKRQSPARDAKNPNHIQYQRATVDYGTADAASVNSAAGLQVMTLSKGAFVIGTQVVVEALLAGGTPALKFGTTVGGADLIANNAYAAVAIGALTVPATQATFALPLAADTPIYARDTGAATTSGKVHAIVQSVF